MNIPCTCDVGDQNQVEVRVAIDGESNSSFLHTRHPSKGNGHDSSTVLSNLQESRLGQIEVLEGRVAPATIVVRQSVVRWAKVCSGDGDGGREAPFGVVVASHLVASPAAQPIVEQGCA